MEQANSKTFVKDPHDLRAPVFIPEKNHLMLGIHNGMEGKIIHSPMATTCRAMKGTAELITSPIVY